MMRFASSYSIGYYLSKSYVQNALIVAVLVALCAALLGVSLVLKRYSLIGDGLSHVAFGAMAVAAVLNLSEAELYITIPVTVIAAVILLSGSSRSKTKGDAAVALVSVSSLAIAYLLFSKFSGGNVNNDVCKTLFGSSSILTLKKGDVILSIVMAAVVLAFFVLFYNKIFAVTFDDPFARATGVPARLYNVSISVVTGIVIALAMKLVGALLITALIVFPALAAMRLSGRFRNVVFISAGISVAGAVGGILISLLISGLPVGSTIVVVDLLIYLVCVAVSVFRSRNVRRIVIMLGIAAAAAAVIFAIVLVKNGASAADAGEAVPKGITAIG